MALYEKTASELSELLGKKKISAVELAKDVFARTKAVEDKVQGYVTVAEESALAQAEAVDKKRASGDTLSALAGIPIAIKDNICTKGTLTTCASKMLGNFKPPYNATVMEKLIASDAVITGKGNILVKLYCVDNEHLMRTIFDGILRIQGIATTETNISLQEVFQREVNIDFIDE